MSDVATTERSSSRRNLFSQDRRTVTQRTQSSCVPSSFYGRVTTVNARPGEYLPTEGSSSPSIDVHSLLSEMQCSELTQLQGTLSSIVDRLSNLEESVAVYTARLSSQLSCSTPVSTPSTSSCESSGGCPSYRKRKRRRLPTELSYVFMLLLSIIIFLTEFFSNYSQQLARGEEIEKERNVCLEYLWSIMYLCKMYCFVSW